MSNGSKNMTITVPKALIERAAGVAIVPLNEYEALLEDIAMLRSKHLAADIAAARAEKTFIPLEHILDGYGISR